MFKNVKNSNLLQQNYFLTNMTHLNVINGKYQSKSLLNVVSER